MRHTHTHAHTHTHTHTEREREREREWHIIFCILYCYLQLTLEWSRAVQVFDYFKPTSMPEYDSYRTSTVSAEVGLLSQCVSVNVWVGECEGTHTKIVPFNIYIYIYIYICGDRGWILMYIKNTSIQICNKYLTDCFEIVLFS